MPDPLDRLTKLFERFPGIGPRQAGRFVQYLLRTSPSFRKQLIDAVRDLGGSVKECASCHRFFAEDGRICFLCANPARDDSALAIVATDADLSALERSHTFRGRYFVLGGTVALTADRASGLRIEQFLAGLPKRIEQGLEEIILAFPANPEGDATIDKLREEVAVFPNIKITTLGRGLSTGSELEYADPETIKSAIDNRK